MKDIQTNPKITEGYFPRLFMIFFSMLWTLGLFEQSTKEERRAFVMEAWKCLHDCESCGKCRVLKGKDAETLYADYIEGERTYMDVTLDIRNNNYGR